MGSKRTRNDKSYGRKSSGLRIREFLIVCQGKETEKKYFKALRDFYRLEGIDIKVKDKSPDRMMEFICN